VEIRLTADMLAKLAEALREGEAIASLYRDRNDGYEAVVVDAGGRIARYVRWVDDQWSTTS